MTDIRRALTSGQPQKRQRHHRKVNSATEVLAKLKARLAYGWMEINQGNPVAWILAQCIGRLNQQRPGNPTSNLCFCHSTLHVICNIADPRTNTENTILFHNSYVHNLYEFIHRLGFRPFSASNFRVSLTVFIEALRGRRIVAWIPHLSPLDYTPIVRRLIYTLNRLQSVKHIDDGMGFISRETLIYRQNNISLTAQIYSWDFLTASAQAGFPLTVPRSLFDRALEVVRSRYPSLISEGLTKIKAIKPLSASKQLNIVLASKLLDADLCLKQLGGRNPDLDTFYIPHYNQAKNDLQLALLYPSLSLKMPEFGLLGITEMFSCRIFFGVTVSAIFLVELLLRSMFCQSLQLVFTINQACPANQAKEVKHFKALLNQYQNNQDLIRKHISVVALTGETNFAGTHKHTL